MLAALVLLTLLVAATIYITRPQRLGYLTAELLERATGAIVEIDYAYLSLDGGVQLEGVRFGVPDLPNELARLGDIGSVRLTPDIWSLARGELRVRSIVLLEPTLYLTRHADDDRYNYQHLLRPSEEPGQQWLVDALPEIFIRGGRLRFAEVDETGASSLGIMDIQGRLIRDLNKTAGYQFTLHQQGQQLLPGVVLHGSLDLTRQRVATSLQGFQFTDQQQQLLPGPLRDLWRQLDPAGEMPEITLRYDANTPHGLEAELRMHDVAMSIPAPGIDARVRNVTALLRLRGDRLHIESLTGEIEGIAYHIEGDIDPFDLNAPMRLKLVTEPFGIHESPPPYLAGLPEIVHRQYARFQPTGRFQTDFTLWRDEHAGQLKYDGTVNLLGAAGRYEKFPAPAHDLHGQIHINHEQVRVENVRGRSTTGAHVRVDGTITPPGKEPAVDVRVEVRGGSVDEHLMAALKPDHRRIVNMFMYEPGRAELIDAGLIRNTPPMIPQWRDRLRRLLRSDTTPPIFAFIGRMDCIVEVKREQGPADAQATVHLTPHGPVPLLFKHWRYPVYMTAGRVTINPDNVHVDNVRIRGLTGATAHLTGHIQLNDGNPQPDLTVEQARLPIDPLLLASVPTPQDRWVRQLGITGNLDATGVITHDAQGGADFALTLKLADGQATPYHGDFTFTNVDSQLLLKRDAAELQAFSGHRGDGRVIGQGTFDWADGKPTIDLRLAADGLAIEPALIDLLPPDHPGRVQAREVFERHQPTGVVDAELYLGDQAGPDATALDDGAPPYRLVVRPRHMNVIANDQAFDLQAMTGHVTFVAGQAELKRLGARFDAGQVVANGIVMLDDTHGVSLQLTGELDDLTDTWTALLPRPVQQTLNTLQARGRASIDHIRLLARPQADDGTTLEVDGQLTLRNTQLNVGLPVNELHGRLNFDVEHRADQTSPDITVQLNADRLIARDREVTELGLTLRSDPQAEAVRLDQLQGKIYGGVLVGSGMFGLRDDAGYHVELALQDVQLDPFLTAPDRRRAEQDAEDPSSDANTTPPPPADDDAGRLNASLNLRGQINDPDSRRGRGAMAIQQARLYQRPLALALLQAVNFSLPLAGSFDRGAASYLIEGETVYFDHLVLEAPGVAIHGGGTMHYPTGELDLNLRGSNPAGPNLGIISDVVNLVKDQIVAIRITGTIEEPEARVIGLENFSRPWSDAFDAEP